MGNNNYPEQCRCCSDYLSSKKDKLVYQWSLCSVIIPIKPSIDRKRGGHLILFPHRHIVKRSDLNSQEAIALMRASMIIEQAMYDVLPSLGIDLVNINIQDSGNLKVDEPFEKRHLHLHFYGRIKDNKDYTHRRFLCLPSRDSEYYNNLKSFNKKDIILLKERIKELDKDTRFDFNK
ncbi:HIT domain-containing protein [Patescibacteria group bacterium]|nr:HIT domain-containing protein [Patescibacteria group bacterium]